MEKMEGIRIQWRLKLPMVNKIISFLSIFLAKSLLGAAISINVIPGDVLSWDDYQHLINKNGIHIILSDPSGEVQISSNKDINILNTIQCNGNIRLTAKSNIKHYGTITAPQIILEASTILLTQSSTLDASTSDKGGNIYVGGGWQGIDPSIKHANVIYVEEGSQILANALSNGPGGTVVLWADIRNSYEGYVSAQGMGSLGNGGNVEISSLRSFQFQGEVNVLGSNGVNGQLLLDPDTITIQLSNPNIFGTPGGMMDMTSSTELDSPTNIPGADSVITTGALESFLTTGATLTLAAVNSITLSDALTAPGTGVTLILAAPTVNLNAPITLPSGTLTGSGVTTINVGVSGNAQNGADLAIAGTTVNLASATYPAPINITKDLILVGSGQGNTIIKIEGSIPLEPITGRNPVIYVTNTANAVIKNLTVDGDYKGFGPPYDNGNFIFKCWWLYFKQRNHSNSEWPPSIRPGATREWRSSDCK